MKKIAVMGMCNHSNLGDQIIPKTVGYLLNLIGNVEYKYVNFIDELSGNRYEKYIRIRKKLNSEKNIYELMKIYVWNTYEKQLQDCDGIIIACGSFKYRTQYLWASYCIILEFARLHNIPVMFNSMNIQKFDKNDWRSMMLKTHINNGCVKVFTTRDGNVGVRKLKSGYVTSNMKILATGDPALWVREAYQQCISNAKTIRIGINLIRETIFEDYGGGVERERLICFYSQLLEILDKNGIDWCLFTNGMSVDEDLIDKINGIDINRAEKVYVPRNDEELVKFISSCEFIVGARLHACIIAYAIGVPFVGFFWDDKLLRFAQENELMNSFCSGNLLSAEWVYRKYVSYSKDYKTNITLINEWKKKTLDSIKYFCDTEV